jgi:hypothetical protein
LRQSTEARFEGQSIAGWDGPSNPKLL